MTWEKINTPITGIPYFDNVPCQEFRSGALKVLISRDPPDSRWHLSISHPHRYPTWDEIKRARYDLVPDGVTMAVLLPPKSQYVNVHPNCFHLHEWRDELILPG